MNAIFDILLLIVAIAAIWKLRSVLGQRTGFERTKAADMPLKPPAEQKSPQRATAPFIANDIEKDAQPVLDSFRQKDKTFSIHEFLKGARIAYQAIVEAFARGDMEVLKNLVKQNVAERFQAEIERRTDKNHHAKASVKKILRAHITKAVLNKIDEQEEAQITVEMNSHQLAWIEDEEGRIIAGDPNTPRDMKDVWTFARTLNTKDPNWRLMATGA